MSVCLPRIHQWGCRWFAEWALNIEQAVAAKHNLVVYFFKGQAGKGTVPWERCADHVRLQDAVLEGLDNAKQRAIKETEEYPFDGIGTYRDSLEGGGLWDGIRGQLGLLLFGTRLGFCLLPRMA